MCNSSMPAATRLHWPCCTYMIYCQHADFDSERFLYEHKLKELIHVRVQVIIITPILYYMLYFQQYLILMVVEWLWLLGDL